MNKKIIVSVISDLVTDQRVQKECNTLHKMGYTILLIGRKSENAFELDNFPYRVVRFANLFRRGPFMYLLFNIQLFCSLLFKRADVLWANDLDTLLPNFIISRLKRIPLIYDSHEYFTLSVYKKNSRRVWEFLERILFPHLKNVITVNDSIKRVYEEKYRVPLTVIRNVPNKIVQSTDTTGISVPSGKKILIMQGIGLNENRGAEEAVLSMQFLPEIFVLYFIGNGTVWHKLRQMVNDLDLSRRVIFIDVLPYGKMMKYTRQCFLGLIFEKIDVTDQHLFALPNKFFDYLHAGVPVLSSKAVEIETLINKYQVGDFINSFEPHEIAGKIIEISEHEDVYSLWKHNTILASEELNWEHEEKKLTDFMDHIKK
ncbi:MAG: glycosyltransferase [Ginsengibacter sp.]